MESLFLSRHSLNARRTCTDTTSPPPTVWNYTNVDLPTWKLYLKDSQEETRPCETHKKIAKEHIISRSHALHEAERMAKLPKRCWDTSANAGTGPCTGKTPFLDESYLSSWYPLFAVL